MIALGMAGEVHQNVHFQPPDQSGAFIRVAPAQIQNDPVVIDAYLGTAGEDDGPGGADGEKSLWN